MLRFAEHSGELPLTKNVLEKIKVLRDAQLEEIKGPMLILVHVLGSIAAIQSLFELIEFPDESVRDEFAYLHIGSFYGAAKVVCLSQSELPISKQQSAKTLLIEGV